MTDRDINGRFVKGTSGNPAGRLPKEREERYRAIVLSTISYDDFKAIIEKQRDKALRGDYQATKLILDYLIGPPVQRQEHTGIDGGALTITITERHGQAD